MTPAEGRRAVPRWPFVLVLALGLVLRLLRYGWKDSLWGDEVMLALNIAHRSFGGLLRPLDYGQIAPIPFLWLERAAVQLFGVNEYALRAVPLLVSCALLLLLLPFARRFLTPLETLVAVGLCASSTWLIRYSAELKPYGFDTLVALLMVWAAVEARRAGDRPSAWLRLGVAAAAGALLSPTALFVCAGIVAGLGADLVRRPSLRGAARVAGVGAACGAAVVFTYVAWYRSAATSTYIREFWQEAFLIPGSPRLGFRTWAGIKETLLPVADWMVILPFGGLLLFLLGVGAARLRARHGVALPLMLAVPVLAAFGASAAGRYPIATRLLLFSSPLLICLTAAGLVAAAAWAHDRLPAMRSNVLAVALVIPSVEIAIWLAVAHPQDEELRPIVTALAARGPEPAYVFYRVIPAWTFYTTDWTRPDTSRLDRMARLAGPGGRSHENGPQWGGNLPGDPADLETFDGRRTELLGLSSGVQGRHWLGYPPTPDPRWAPAEAARIRAAAAPGVWIVLINDRNAGEGDSLLAAVGRAGGARGDSVSVPGGRALRVVFEPAVASQGDSSGARFGRNSTMTTAGR